MVFDFYPRDFVNERFSSHYNRRVEKSRQNFPNNIFLSDGSLQYLLIYDNIIIAK